MNRSSKFGLSFGATSGIITTLGLIVGLAASDATRATIVGGVLTIAFADAFSDALGIHISEESENLSKSQVWAATFFTFISKIIIPLTFLVPLTLTSPTSALIASIIWGIVLLTLINYIFSPKIHRWKAITGHLVISLVVIIIGFIIGQYIRDVFK